MAKASEKRVLVVDDEPDVRNFLATCIEDAGFSVETACDGEDALDKVKANIPDLMTLDMVMPRRSGISLMRKLRKNKDWANIPVIVVTAHAKDEFGSKDVKELQAFAARQRPHYTFDKPVTPEKIVKAIADILKVEIEQDTADSTGGSKSEIANMLENADEEKLKKIRDMLK